MLHELGQPKAVEERVRDLVLDLELSGVEKRRFGLIYADVVE